MRNWMKAVVVSAPALLGTGSPAGAVALADGDTLGNCTLNVDDININTGGGYHQITLYDDEGDGFDGYAPVPGGRYEKNWADGLWDIDNDFDDFISATTLAYCLGIDAAQVADLQFVSPDADPADDGLDDGRFDLEVVKSEGIGFGFVLDVDAGDFLSGEFYSATIGGAVLDGLPAGAEPSSPAAAVSTAITSDISRATASAVSSNARMMSGAGGRFSRLRKSGQRIADAIATSSVNSLAITPDLKAIGDEIDLSGTFSGQSVSADGVYRRVTFGEFDVQHTIGSGTTLSFNGRTAWERAAGDDAMIAYFLGAEVNKSEVEGTYTGDMNRIGVSAGVYGFKALDDNLFLGGFGSLGVARSEMDTTDGEDSNITGDYLSRTLSLGGQLSGSVEYDAFELRPSASLSYVKTFVGDITLDNSGEALEVPVGNTTFAGLTLSPEFLFPMEQQNGSNMTTVASVAPRVQCELTEASGATTRECGPGLTLGINGTSEDGATNLNASIRFDRVGGVDRKGLNLQADFRF